MSSVIEQTTVSFAVVVFLICQLNLLEKVFDLSVGDNQKSYAVTLLKGMWSDVCNTRRMSWSHASIRCRWPLGKGSVTLVLWYCKHDFQETAYILSTKMCSRCSKVLTSQHLVYGKFCAIVILSYVLKMTRIYCKINMVLTFKSKFCSRVGHKKQKWYHSVYLNFSEVSFTIFLL